MTESVNALGWYIDEVAVAFAPSDVKRALLAVGAGSITPQIDHQRAKTLDELVRTVEQMCIPQEAGVAS